MVRSVRRSQTDLKMACTHPQSVRSKFADMICGLVDAGSGAGYLLLLNANDVEVARLTFSQAVVRCRS
jgi:hypothetical protein